MKKIQSGFPSPHPALHVLRLRMQSVFQISSTFTDKLSSYPTRRMHAYTAQLGEKTP